MCIGKHYSSQHSGVLNLNHSALGSAGQCHRNDKVHSTVHICVFKTMAAENPCDAMQSINAIIPQTCLISK